MPGGRFLSRAGLVLVPVAVFVAAYAFLDSSTAAPRAEAAQPVPAPFTLEKGDHICIIGNTLADRMQHDGWVESFLYARHPDLDLTVRNLGFSGDEVNFRQRSQDFGTPDQWLSASAPIPQPTQIADRSVVNPNRFEKAGTRADVVFAFFGYNESFAGEAGLPKFKDDLAAFVKHTRNQQYNGKSAPRLVLFSPIAFEDHKSPNLPTGATVEQTNKNLALYTRAIGEVAKALGVNFVDLFQPSKAAYARAQKPLTINGVHLNEAGDRKLAEIIDASLFPQAGAYAAPNEALLTQLRPAVQDKAFHWYQRYRVTDGYSTYGGRAWLRFTGGQSNYEVVQKELEVLDIKTANRDKVIWEIARGKEAKVDDSNLPAFVHVPTNKPGRGPGGEHIFLSGEGAIKAMTLGKGLKVNLFASEEQWPELAKPVQMAWDAKGRLWVAVWPSYPHWKPGEPYNDKLLIFEDTDGDGKADKMTVFADGLQNPTGFEFYNGGVIVAQAPELIFLKDSKGGDKADVRERLIHGLDTADTHHTANSFVLDPGGALYFQEGTFHRTQVEDPYGPVKRLADGGVFRYQPRSQKFDVYVTYGFANPHGHVFDKWGQDIVVDGTGANPYHGALFSGYLPFPQKHAHPPQVYQQRTRPCGGIEVLSSKHFPPEWEGNLIVTNCIGFQGLLRYKISALGGSLSGQEQEPVLSSSDPNFRPVDCKTGPDGALYFIDWQNPIIGHMQHNLRDPSRDRKHGRIYKVTYDGRAPSQSPKVAGESIENLLDLLKQPEDRVRYRAKVELGARKSDEVVAAATKWVAALPAADATNPDAFEHARLEGLWVHQYHNAANVDLLKAVLASPDFRARAAAVRVLCEWRDRVPDALELLKQLAADEHPRVRLEAVRAASFFTVPEAAEVVFVAQDKQADPFVEFVIKETMRALGPIVQKAIADKRPIKFTTAAGARYFLKSVATDDLLKMDRTPAVYLELLFRPGVRDEFRREALAALAKQDKKPELDVLVTAVRAHDESAATDDSVAFDLARLLTGLPRAELAAGRSELEALAAKGRNAATRQMGYVALVAAEGDVEKVWARAARSVGALQDFVNAVPMVRDPAARAALYPKVKALLGGLPPELAKTVGTGKSVSGRYVRIELPGKQRTLTLAEVQVMSDGSNVARQGRATQSSTAYGGAPGRAIDGNTNGSYADGSSTHTLEGTENPWWQVDLGREVPIQSVTVWNRTDGGLGSRLADFTLRVLDADKRAVFESVKNPAPSPSADVKVGAAAPERVIRRAAMFALATVRGQEADAFKAIAKFLAEDGDRAAAVQALLRINSRDWPKEDAKAHLDTVLKFIRALPVTERTGPVALDFMQLGEALTGLLAPAEARAARKELADIGVRVIRVGTLFDQMSYDKERLAVQAGKPVEFAFENTDIMPHNFVIVTPGNLEKVGAAAEAFATSPGAAAAQYVPAMPPGVVLLKSKLLQTRQTERLKFTAPTEPGIYPYVCTYPGHWRRMHGALYVVADLEAYQENPEAYLAKAALPVRDDLLKFNRPRTEWKLEELTDAVKEMETKGGRNFANGKQMFTVATCVACHKFGGQGNEFGPDLAKLDPKTFKSAADLTDHVLNPSKKIDDRYATYRIVTSDEKVYTAMIVEEKDGVVKIIENPLASAKPIEIKRADIAEQKKAPTSMMPKGLLDKLTREEVLDLLAYVWGRADPKSKLFSGGHDH
ncbi:PVC-type heme-binding CxxCH protein [Frigoriglobus tundricola]|uniref:Beta-propeller-type glycoside hydrolase n=1 Tax=Frigoriglobus tundricola TaxID=2774151 RepID=A0A6M5YHH3_9BACT|nr:PVC-type heme-binding CxxCH protein [Frigoriglobus tundricola]QJW92716.1 beta-propeller-type glycoside hydrolase [Frigoriglobus tundricola]